MDDLVLHKLSTNSLNFKSSLERIIDKYSKLQYQDGGIEVDLDITSVETLESYMKLSRANLKKLDSKSLTDLREESMRAQDVTTDSQMEVTYQDGGSDETTQFPVDSDGSSFNDTTRLTVASLNDSQRSLSYTELQPEDQDQELEQSLRRHSSLVELYPSMIRRIGRAWQRQHVSEAAGSVLRRYRRWRQQNRSALGNTFIVTLRDTSTTGPEATVPHMSPGRAAPVQSVLVMDLTAPEESSLNQTFVMAETSWLGGRTLAPSPSKRLSVGSLQTNSTFLSDTSSVRERPDVYGSPVRPRMLGGLSRSPQTFSRAPRAQSTETFSWSPKGPRAQSMETFSRSPKAPRAQSMETFSRSPKAPRAQSMETFSRSPKAPRAQSMETFSRSPKAPRAQSMETFSRSPKAPRVQSMETSPRAPRVQSLETFSRSPKAPRVQSLETFSRSPKAPRPHSMETSRAPRVQSLETFSRSPKAPRVQSLETFSNSPRSPRGPRAQSVETFSREPLRLRLVSPQKPLRVLYPQDSHQPLQPCSGGHRGLRRHLSFDSALPSPRKLDEDFLKLYHKFVCQSKSVFSGMPCRLCTRSANASRGPSLSSSSSSLAALALSPHRSLLRKRHRELDWDRRAKRCRDESSSPGSRRSGTEMMRRYLTPSQPTFSPERRHETWATQRRHVTTADFSGIGSSPERRTTISSSPRKW